MTSIIWTAGARRAREKAIDYIADHNDDAALKQIDEIITQTRRLMTHPELGRPGRVTGSRELSINRTPFIVFYRVTASGIEIFRFHHSSQKL